MKRLDASSWKEYIDGLASLQGQLSADTPLGNVIRDLKNLMADFSQSWPDQFTDIDDSYRLMCDYLLRGFKDSHRESLYTQLAKRLYRLLSDMSLAVRLRFDPKVLLFSKMPNTDEFDVESLRGQLESFVSDMAMLSLGIDGNNGGDDTTSARRKALYELHHANVSRAFVSIVKSGQWSRELAGDASSLVLSPTIDTIDAQVLCSAIMLAALLSPDAGKVAALIDIYKGATDEHLRQRAFVGWVLAVDACDLKFFDKVRLQVTTLLNDDNVRATLMELQMQIVYCMGAEHDNETIQKDVMPTIMRNQNLEITRYGIREKEEDPMEDILHGDETDRKMEELEQGIRKVMDMQKQGVDIYFGGFSKMKRFSFFYTLCNWFMPFYSQHPGLERLSPAMLQSGFLKALFENGPFCDSDKYSFALGMSSIYDGLPDNIKEMVANGASAQVIGASEGNTQSPAFIRRLYLQDLYRFFRVNDSRQAFHDPFSGADGYLFFDNPVFRPHLHDEAIRIVRFLLKRRQQVESSRMAEAYYDGSKATDLQLRAHIMMSKRRYAEAEELFARAYAIDPESRETLKGYALASFRCGHYDVSTELYRRLSDIFPEREVYRLNLSISLINGDKAEDGVKTLYELYYTSPDNLDVKRALAWGQLCIRHTEQASRLYGEILASGNTVAADYLNAGYCAWFCGELSKASKLFAQYTKKAGTHPAASSNGNVSLMSKFSEDASLLDKYAIPQVDRLIMAGFIS